MQLYLSVSSLGIIGSASAEEAAALSVVTQFANAGSGNLTKTVNLSAGTASAPCVVTVAARDRGGSDINSLTIDGTSMTLITTQPASGNRMESAIFSGTLPATGLADVEFVLGYNGTSTHDYSVLTVYELSAVPTVRDEDSVDSASADTLSATVTATAGDILIGCGSDDNPGTATATGVSNIQTTTDGEDDYLSGYATAAGGSVSFTIDDENAGGNSFMGAALVALY